MYVFHPLISNNPFRPSFLSRTELEWLLGNKQSSGNYNRKIKSQIRKKINNFQNFELPLLIEKGCYHFHPLPNLVTVLLNTVTQILMLPHQTVKLVLK